MDDKLDIQFIRHVNGYAAFTIDPEGIITSWNDEVEKVLGYAEEAVMGQPARMIFTPENRQAGVPEQELATAREQSAASDDRSTLRKDGSVFWAGGLTSSVWAGAAESKNRTPKGLQPGGQVRRLGGASGTRALKRIQQVRAARQRIRRG